MKEDKDFNVTVSLSKQGYNSKDECKAAVMNDKAEMKRLGLTETMRFKRTTLSLPNLLDRIRHGYSMCGLYSYAVGKKVWINTSTGKSYYTLPTEKDGYMKRCIKRSEFWCGSQVVCIDIDETAYTDIPTYLNKLSYLPTFCYATFSDKPDSRRFRLVYVMSKVLKLNEFKAVSTVLHREVEKDTLERCKDNCGTRQDQYFNGCSLGSECYSSDLVYDLKDIRGYYDVLLDLIAEEEEEQKIAVDPKLIYDLKNLSYGMVLKNYYGKFEYYYRSKVEFDEGQEIKLVSEENGYYELYYRWENDSPKKYVDGEHRRAKMGNYARLRRLIKPDVTSDELLLNLYIDRERFFDNSDDVLTIDYLVGVVKKAMRKDLPTLQAEYEESRKVIKKVMKSDYHQKKVVVNTGLVSRKLERGRMQGLINKGIKEWNYYEIDLYYNPELTVKENLEVLKKNGIEVCEKTLYNYCKDRGIVLKLTDDDLRKLINPSLSVRKNLENIKGLGYKVGINKVQKILRELNDNNNQSQP